jgi:hypothetical protein
MSINIRCNVAPFDYTGSSFSAYNWDETTKTFVTAGDGNKNKLDISTMV